MDRSVQRSAVAPGSRLVGHASLFDGPKLRRFLVAGVLIVIVGPSLLIAGPSRVAAADPNKSQHPTPSASSGAGHSLSPEFYVDQSSTNTVSAADMQAQARPLGPLSGSHYYWEHSPIMNITVGCFIWGFAYFTVAIDGRSDIYGNCGG